MRLRNTLSPSLLTAALITILSLGVFSRVHAQTPEVPDFLVTTRSAFDFDDTVQRLKAAIEEQNLMLVHEVDAQRMLRMIGVQTKGMRQLLFFHPSYMNRILEANRNGAIEPPLKLAVMEMPDGKVMVRYVDPTYLLGRYSGLEDIGRELKGVVETITAVTHSER